VDVAAGSTVRVVDYMAHQPTAMLDQHADMHVVEDDELTAPLAISLHLRVLLDGARKTRDQERGERQGLAGPCLVRCDPLSRDRDVDLQEPEHAVRGALEVERVEPGAAPRRQIDDVSGHHLL
jgi:hypothetical protein